jgi:hypothetical protein
MEKKPPNPKYSVAEMFCGCGGFSHGFWRTGQFETVLGNDVKKYALETFRLNHSHGTHEPEVIEQDIRRNLAKINYRIHTDAVQANQIPPELTPQQISFVCANEADVLNTALFGMTAKQWRDRHPEDKGSIRDHANAAQLVCLSNLENLNALFISEGLDRKVRLMKLNQTAIRQMVLLTDDSGVRRLGS